MVLFALLTGRNKTELSLLEPLWVIGNLRGFVTGSSICQEAVIAVSAGGHRRKRPFMPRRPRAGGVFLNGIGVPEPAPRPRHPRPNLTRDNSRMPTIAGGSQYTAREYELTSGGDVPRRRTPRIPCRRLYRARIQQPSQVRPAGALVSIPARATHTVSDPLDLGFLIRPLSRVGPTRDPACTRHEPYLRCPTLTETETTSVRRKDNRPGS